MITPQKWILIFIAVFLIIELFLHILLIKLRSRFSNMIITGKDKLPAIDKNGLNKFLKIGYDPELGWVRKPNTSKTEKSFSGVSSYHINSYGSRRNPTHENLRIKVDTFGDSYTFGRHINDNETWQFWLAEFLKCNVTNFGVGNYGLDQAFLRFKRESGSLKGNIVIMGIVPETIKRNLSVWKHYNEFGNTLGFKPRFKIERGKLKLVPNPIDNEAKFFEIKKHLCCINQEDFFYEEKFKNYLFTFPYALSILKSPKRKLSLLFFYSVACFLEIFHINWKKMKIIPKTRITRHISFNLQDKMKYYRSKALLDLTARIIKEFSQLAKSKGKKPIFIIMPEYDDIEYIKRTGHVFYKPLLNRLRRLIPALDLSKALLNEGDIEELYVNKEYGGHYNSKGNKIVAHSLYNFIGQHCLRH